MMLFSTWAESVRQKELEEVMEYMPACASTSHWEKLLRCQEVRSDSQSFISRDEFYDSSESNLKYKLHFDYHLLFYKPSSIVLQGKLRPTSV